MGCVILSFNHKERTKRCVESALTFFAPCEVILVHNGSLPENVTELQLQYPEINHLLLEENSGFTGGANAGLNRGFESGFNQILFLTNDTQLIEFKKLDVQEGVFAPLVKKRGRDVIDCIGGKVDMKKGQIIHLKALDAKMSLDFVPGCAFLVTKQSWMLLKGFDEKYFCYWEDVDLGFRAKKLGIPLIQTGDIKINHDISKTTGKKPFYTFYLFQRNRYHFMKTYSPKAGFLLFSLFWWSEQLVKFFKCFINKDFVRLELSRKLFTEKC